MRLSLPSPDRSPLRHGTERDQRYRLVLLCSLALTLALVLGLTRLPWTPSLFRADWRAAGTGGPIVLDFMPRTETRDETGDSPSQTPATVLLTPREDAPPVSDEPAAPDTGQSAGTSGEGAPLDRFDAMTRMPVVSFAEEQPDIVGGLHSLYLRVRYPLAAQEAGIQGLVIVQFIVETDGRPSQVEVVQSLHPLCDDAAVDAIRATTFRPARQNGQIVRSRLSLPIRFVLLDEQTGRPLETDTTTTQAPPNEPDTPAP